MSPTPTDIRAAAESYARAWTEHSDQGVAAHYQPDGRLSINRAAPFEGRAAIAAMAAGYFAQFPNLSLDLDDVRIAGDHAVFLWTLKGTHRESGASLSISGWEEWTITDECRVQSSLGWFDEAEYEHQIEGRNLTHR